MSGAPVQSDDAAYEPATGTAFGKKGIGWAIFEFARNPYYNVIVISLYAPYFAKFVVGDETQGQAMVGWTIAIAGIIMAVVAPILGSLIDTGGRRKFPAFLALSVLGITAFFLWFIEPNLPNAVVIGMALMATGYCAYTVAELFHNAMLPMAARPSSLPVVSGLGISLGNFGSILFLVLLSIFITGTDTPLFGLDTENGETSRISGPLVALWLGVFIMPFFILMPDIEKTPDRSWRLAIRTTFADKGGIGGLFGGGISYVKEMFREHPNVMRYLLARMVYADGIAALLTLGSVYVGGVLGWGANQLVLAGIVGGLCAVLGALAGGFVDQAIGPKRSIMFELSCIIVLLTLQLSITSDGFLFGLVPAGHEVWPGGPFPRLSDLAYVMLLVPASMMLGAVITSSRYMLVHIAPPENIGQFFGFYAMAGSVTVWIGPGLVALMTTLSGDQRIGMSGLVILFITGLWTISGVKADKTPTYLQAKSDP
ncbi:MAG: MFS transporter [Hyphomonadaceae bacterium]